MSRSTNAKLYFADAAAGFWDAWHETCWLRAEEVCAALRGQVQSVVRAGLLRCPECRTERFLAGTALYPVYAGQVEAWAKPLEVPPLPFCLRVVRYTAHGLPVHVELPKEMHRPARVRLPPASDDPEALVPFVADVIGMPEHTIRDRPVSPTQVKAVKKAAKAWAMEVGTWLAHDMAPTRYVQEANRALRAGATLSYGGRSLRAADAAWKCCDKYWYVTRTLSDRTYAPPAALAALRGAPALPAPTAAGKPRGRRAG